MAQIKLVAYGIAKDIVGARELVLELDRLSDIASLKQDLVVRYPDFSTLVKFSLAVNEEYQEDDFIINDGDEIVIIPPVSGG